MYGFVAITSSSLASHPFFGKLHKLHMIRDSPVIPWKIVCVCDIFYIKFSGKQKTSTQPPTNQPTHQPTNPNHPILGCSTTEFLSHFAFPPSTTTASLPGARNFRRKNGAKAWRRRGRCGESPPTSVAWGMGTEKLFCHWSMTMKIYMKNNRIKCSLKQVIGITSQKSIHL